MATAIDDNGRVLLDSYTGEKIQIDVKGDSSASTKGDISKPCYNYAQQQARLDLIRTLLGGTEAMLAAGTTYLPKEPKESTENYNNRLSKTILFNGFGRTVSYLTGQIFSKPITWKEDIPEVIRGTKNKDGYIEDMDLRGNNADVFLADVFARGISDGVTTCLAEYPPTEGPMTKAEADKRGLRPYWVHIPTESIIGWKTERRNGKEVFTQLRIKEVFEKDDLENAYNTVEVNRIRLLEPGKYEVWEEPDKSKQETDWKMISFGNSSITDLIPLAVFMPGERLSALTAKPPLEDLAYLNLSHWQSTSDQTNILHFTRLPILFGKKLSDPNKLGEIELGPNRMIHSDHPDSELKYVEHQGAAINAGHAQLIDLETKMALFGLQLLMPNTGNVTATERALSSGESDSTLRSWALEFKDFVEQLLVFTSKYIGENSGGSVDVNTDFRWMQTMDAEVLLRAAQFKILPKELVFEELRRRGILNADWEWAEVMAMFDKEDFLGGAMSIGSPDLSKYTSVATDTSKSPAGVGSPFSIKRGPGK